MTDEPQAISAEQVCWSCHLNPCACTHTPNQLINKWVDTQFERAAGIAADTLAEWHDDDEHRKDFLPECRAVVRALMGDGWIPPVGHDRMIHNEDQAEKASRT